MNKNKYFIHIRNLKQALNYELVLKTGHRILKTNQKKLVKTIYWLEHGSKKKSKKWF